MPLAYCPGSLGVVTNSMRSFWIRRLFQGGDGGGVFRAESDYGRLIEMAFACSAPGGIILLSTNCSSLDASRLRTLGRRHVSASVTFSVSPALPDIPAGHGAATVWMQLGQ